MDRRSRFSLARALALTAVIWAAAGPAVRSANPRFVQFVFTSDAHYGITRPAFRGSTNVDAHVVNAALVARINTLPGVKLPDDGGLRKGLPVGAIDFLVESGDVANRSEIVDGKAIQSAAVSWAQFETDYVRGLTLKNASGTRTPVFVVPGNHDASNAVGFYRPMLPAIDKTAMAEIYNRMMSPPMPRTSGAYDYARDKVLTARDFDGIHFVFVTVWPDTAARAWMEADLGKAGNMPVMIFAHDEPDAEAKHFRNPNGTHAITKEDRFENVLSDEFKDGPAISGKSILEQADLENFLLRHPNVSAYFHGNSNWNQFYDWRGPHNTIALHAFRVDSPMKGDRSRLDETRLSFQLATIDVDSRTMTVRECLWNPDPKNPSSAVAWGGSTTVSLFPRPTTADR
ncbi:MAG TPA: metallophosphoesterase [Vicinamibacterales bacterium]|nr:metallophosphoesterase [Vicinamibacterales bacterium]